MTTFNTGNPLGSTDVYDRYDNSENLDNFSNGPLDAYPDRFGVSRQSLQGIRNASQYVQLGAYAAGLQFTALNQVFSYDAGSGAEFYAPGPSITLPYTTTGVGAGEIANFRSVGDAILRSDLSSGSVNSGGALVARSAQVVPSVAALRLLLKTSASKDAFLTGYYAPGDGGGGAYRYDSADTTSADNGGSVIVAADGGRWKLVTTGSVNARSFGFLPTATGAQNVAALTSLFAAFALAIEVYIPGGFYNLSGPVQLPSAIVLKIRGDGKYQTRLFMGSAGVVQAFFTTTGATYDSLIIEDIGFLGNNKAGSAFACENIIHSSFERLLIMNTTASGLRLSNGYNNTVRGCQIFTNLGDGIDASGSNINNLLIDNCQVYDNSGFGVRLGGGNSFSITLVHNGIETNAKGGIAAWSCSGLNIKDNYFERNGSVGVAFTTPHAITVKADILLLSDGLTLPYTSLVYCDTPTIQGNDFTPAGSVTPGNPAVPVNDCIIFAQATIGMTVRENRLFNKFAIKYLVGTDRTGTGAINSYLDIGSNSLDTYGDIFTTTKIPLHLSDDRGDASVTFTPGTDAPTQRFNTNLTANSTMTLSTDQVLGGGFPAREGDTVSAVRLGGGAFTIDVGPGIKMMPAGVAYFVDLKFDGTSWRQVSAGNL